MKYSDNAINIITTQTFKGIGKAWILKNLQGNESVETIVSLINTKSKGNEIIDIDDFEFEKNQVITQLSTLDDACDGLVAIGDKDFPSYRGDVKQSEQPIYLFYKGDISLLDIINSNIAVIGLLNPDENIVQRERKLINEIVKHDITIVSGLAFGCDSIAHEQAIEGGKTIAILPSPLNDILPAKNKGLAYEIVDTGGLLITEYYTKFKSKMELSSRYKERDRLQALFSDTIILAASYAQDSAARWNIFNQKLDCGARLAMEYAKGYNIPRAVIYNDEIDNKNPMFDLNRQLIKEDSEVVIVTKKSLDLIINNVKNKENTKVGLFDF